MRDEVLRARLDAPEREQSPQADGRRPQHRTCLAIAWQSFCLAHTKHAPVLVLYIRPNAQRPAIIDDLLDLAEAGRQDAVDTAILTLEDLYLNGQTSAHARKLKGVPIWELKSHARGGAKGGTRVYFFFRPGGEIVVASAESKEGDAPGPALTAALQAWKADT